MTAKSRPKKDRMKEAEASAGPIPLAEEVRTYEAHLTDWTEREGQFVLIKGQDVLGFYACLEAALEAGYDRFGADPFLVKQVLVHEPVYQLGHIAL
jgi:hypothetical protein